VAGCGGDTGPDIEPVANRFASQERPPRVIAAVFQSLENPFFVELGEGLAEVVEANGDRLVSMGSNWDHPTQVKQIAACLDQQVAALFLNPADWRGLQSSMRRARQQDVPCIVVDTQVENDSLVICQVVSDNVEAGRLAGRSLLKRLQQLGRSEASLAVFHIPPNKACIDRVDGFRMIIDADPRCSLVEIVDGGGRRDVSRTQMRKLLQRHKDLDAVFAVNDPIALGVIEAIESAGRQNEITIVSVDGSPEGIAAVRDGRLHSTCVQFPREIGRVAAQRFYDFEEGKIPERTIRIPLELVTPENVHAFLSVSSPASDTDRNTSSTLDRAAVKP
jgi:ribose transport system substrate-binding protein